MADTLDPAALRKVAEEALDKCPYEMPGDLNECVSCTLARALLQHFDREAAAQQVLATMAPDLAQVRRHCEEDSACDEPFTGRHERCEVDRDRLLSVVAALALRAARDEACRDNAERNCDDLRETYLKVKAERDAARQQLAEVARLLRCEPDQVLARLEQIAAAEPPDVAAMEGRAAEALTMASDLRGHAGVVIREKTPGVCWRGATAMDDLARGLRAILAHSQQQALRIAALEAELKPCAGWQQLAQDRADEIRALKEALARTADYLDTATTIAEAAEDEDDISDARDQVAEARRLAGVAP